jgi:hypothetical protein
MLFHATLLPREMYIFDVGWRRDGGSKLYLHNEVLWIVGEAEFQKKKKQATVEFPLAYKLGYSSCNEITNPANSTGVWSTGHSGRWLS